VTLRGKLLHLALCYSQQLVSSSIEPPPCHTVRSRRRGCGRGLIPACTPLVAEDPGCSRVPRPAPARPPKNISVPGPSRIHLVQPPTSPTAFAECPTHSRPPCTGPPVGSRGEAVAVPWASPPWLKHKASVDCDPLLTVAARLWREGRPRISLGFPTAPGATDTTPRSPPAASRLSVSGVSSTRTRRGTALATFFVGCLAWSLERWSPPHATVCDAAAATPCCCYAADAAAPWRALALPAGVYLQVPRLFLHASHHDTLSKPGERLSVVVSVDARARRCRPSPHLRKPQYPEYRRIYS